MSQYKPRQLTYTNTISSMDQENGKEWDDYYHIREKYEKMVISKLMDYGYDDEKKVISQNLLRFHL